ncbi:MAG: HAMP domain-containing sensor histidine kinase [Candidatus Aminicenantaceae bacterium]
MKRRGPFLVFSFPFLGLLVLFLVSSHVNRYTIRNRVEDLVEEQLQATSEILSSHVSHLLSEDASADEIFPLYSGEENIYFMALLDEERNILGWSSRFEGYLPLSLKDVELRHSWILDSPIGLILNHFSSFSGPDGKTYYIYLGYSLSSLETMLSRSRETFWIIFLSLCGVGILFFLGMVRLQSRYLRKTRELEKQTQEKEHFREISAFTSGVAHEIKNPLNSLSLLCDLFEKKAPMELRRDALAGKAEVRKISRIVDQFSAALKPHSLHQERFVLKDLIEEVKVSFLREYERPSDTIKVESGDSLAMTADRGLLGQVLINLLKNAHESSPEAPIVLKARRQKKGILISVRDSGAGVSPRHFPHIFEPFYGGKKEGLGIGLYLSRKITEAHGGSISAKSSPGQGAEFIIEIPGE